MRNRIEDKHKEESNVFVLIIGIVLPLKALLTNYINRPPFHSSLKRDAHIKNGSNCFLNNPFPQLYRENRRFAGGLLGQACSLSPFNKYANERVSGLFTCRGSNFPTWTRASDQSAAPLSFSAKILRVGMHRGWIEWAAIIGRASKEGVAPIDVDDLETRISINALCDRTRYTHNFEQSRLIEARCLVNVSFGKRDRTLLGLKLIRKICRPDTNSLWIGKIVV